MVEACSYASNRFPLIFSASPPPRSVKLTSTTISSLSSSVSFSGTSTLQDLLSDPGGGASRRGHRRQWRACWQRLCPSRGHAVVRRESASLPSPSLRPTPTHCTVTVSRTPLKLIEPSFGPGLHSPPARPDGVRLAQPTQFMTVCAYSLPRPLYILSADIPCV